jgi:hypothetical protein
VIVKRLAAAALVIDIEIGREQGLFLNRVLAPLA